MAGQNMSRKIYLSVVEDVISNVRESFLDEGVDEQVLQELKQLWESKLHSSRALEPAETDHTGQGNIQYVVQPQAQQHMVPGTTLQHQLPVPVQIATEGQISNAASVAFNAQGGMFAQHVQTLVNMNPGQQLTLQPTANGQFILHTVGSGMAQGQMVTLPHQTILQNQQINQAQSSQGIPQLDGTQDEEASCSQNSAIQPDCCSLPANGASQAHNLTIEIDMSNIDKRKLKRLSRKKVKDSLPQFDGNQDTSSSEDDNYDDDDDDDDEEKEEADEAGGEDEEPLNSEDDVSEVDPQELFDTDNVVVCQFEKVGRIKNKWKFNLKDGIMNLDGKDHVFQRGTGEADW